MWIATALATRKPTRRTARKTDAQHTSDHIITVEWQADVAVTSYRVGATVACPKRSHKARTSSQRNVFGLGSPEDRNVRVGVLPEFEEVREPIRVGAVMARSCSTFSQFRRVMSGQWQLALKVQY